MNAITIADISIRNSENLYNLNDLHRASGEQSCQWSLKSAPLWAPKSAPL